MSGLVESADPPEYVELAVLLNEHVISSIVLGMGDREYFRFADDGERRPILRRSSEQTEQMVNLEELRDVCTEEELRALDACADAPDVNQ